MATEEEAKAKIEQLVSQFERLGAAARELNEANTKKDYIEPLFACLGWKVHDSNEVSAEERASGGRVDYAFKINGVSQFYLEAKPPRTGINRPEYVKQAITYTYNKGITWAVLTDFEELRVFNGQTGQPFLNFSYHEYATRFDDLWLLSREAFESNALSEKALQYGALPPRLRIEQRLYEQLRQWREELFTQVHLHNKQLTLDQVDEIIQRLFNRLIFIRTCEDRGIEERVLLSAVHEWRATGCREQLIEILQGIFRTFDGFYDSDLFRFHITDEVFIEASPIERIIKGLYELPKGIADYDFSVIDADVLGAVYEQYLGHVAVQAQRRVKEAQMRMEMGLPQDEVFELTAKKQKRKEHGIYYTPKFVVDYIVKNTVGRFIEEHSDNEIRNLKILDMACGSGSFLIRAYDELLSYHAYQREKAVVELDQWERLPVLTGNIFGVDIDMQAVEIARLNLLIRSLARREILPSLDRNIRRGNSLISGTDKELKRYFGKSWKDKRPFNWNEEFPEVLRNGGFDIIIGNPPYVGFQGFKEEKEYYRRNYEVCTGRFDLYLPFIEKGMKLLKDGGVLSFICPTNFMKRQHGVNLRKFLKEQCNILQIVDFQDQQVFDQALNYTGIFFFEKSKSSTDNALIYFPKSIGSECYTIKQEELQDRGWVFKDEISRKVLDRIGEQPINSLGDLTESISEGIVTGQNKVFLLPSDRACELGLEEELLKPAVQGKNIHRYFHDSVQKVVIYPYIGVGGNTEPIQEGELERRFPVTYEYLLSQRSNLAGREYFNKSTKAWYELWCERAYT